MVNKIKWFFIRLIFGKEAFILNINYKFKRNMILESANGVQNIVLFRYRNHHIVKLYKKC